METLYRHRMEFAKDVLFFDLNPQKHDRCCFPEAERYSFFREEPELEKFTLCVASSKIGPSEIAKWLKDQSRS
jgi:hypothetical protein